MDRAFQVITFCGLEPLREVFVRGRVVPLTERSRAVRHSCVCLFLFDVSLQRVVSKRRRLQPLHHHLLYQRLRVLHKTMTLTTWWMTYYCLGVDI